MTLIDTPGAEFLYSLHKQYLEALGAESTYDARSLWDKIMKEYGDTLLTYKHADRIYIHNSTISDEVAIWRAQYDDEYVNETAFYFRSNILNSMKSVSPCPHPMTAEAVMNGQDITPRSLKKFFRLVITWSSHKVINQRDSFNLYVMMSFLQLQMEG